MQISSGLADHFIILNLAFKLDRLLRLIDHKNCQLRPKGDQSFLHGLGSYLPLRSSLVWLRFVDHKHWRF
ncbi:hypothetical protein CXF81_14340 [Glaciecola sp. 33A]|nr:hypothetical protein CXF81_14340 [Glaciecola sp. 33A]